MSGSNPSSDSGTTLSDSSIAATAVASPTPTAVGLPDFGAASVSGAAPGAIGLLGDVSLQVRIELGRTKMLVEDVLRLNADSVVELDKAAGDPVDIYVNGRRIARGEVLVLNENFCVRVSEILEPFSA
jgi:flagellar motor switch protein FliN/FliY